MYKALLLQGQLVTKCIFYVKLAFPEDLGVNRETVAVWVRLCVVMDVLFTVNVVNELYNDIAIAGML